MGASQADAARNEGGPGLPGAPAALRGALRWLEADGAYARPTADAKLSPSCMRATPGETASQLPSAPEVGGRTAIDCPTPATDGAGPVSVVTTSVISSVRQRRMSFRRLKLSGETGVTEFVCLPRLEPMRHLVPIEAGPLRYSLEYLQPLPTWAPRRLAPLLTAGPLLRAIRWLAPHIVVVSRPPGSPALCRWMVPEEEHGIEAPAPIVSPSWRDPTASAVLHRFRSGEREPFEVIKVRAGEQGRAELEAEAKVLRELGESAEAAGVRVPKVRRIVRSGDATALALDARTGAVCARVLRRRAATQARVLTVLGEWLLRWGARTSQLSPGQPGPALDRVLGLADELAPWLPGGTEYLRWLAERSRAIVCPVPMVAVHGDLTMWNVLWLPGNAPAVVDWETARRDGLPTTDFVYAAVDAELATRRDGDRIDAFLGTFGRGADSSIRAMHRKLAHAAGLDRAGTDLCFHACWLHHAVNELRRTAADEPRPFLAIAALLSQAPGLLTREA
jgi:hypothetical protein